MTIQTETAEALASKVREGVGLKEAIEQAGLPRRQTLTWLKKHHRQMFKDAKASRAATNA